MGHYVSLINGMSNAQADDFMSFATDLLDGNSGIVASGDYAVAQSSPVAMSVTVATGKAYIYISSLLSYYRTILDAAATLSIASNSSGSTRIDLICIKIDTGASPDADASNVASVVVVQGTPGGGAPATPANHYKLAEVTVASGAASIANANIADSRVQLNIRTGTKVGGVTPGAATDAGITFSDVTTNDASTSKHGFLKKLSNVATQFMNGVGAWVDGVAADGWTLANETWAYASATTITVPSGAANKYSKGDKIRLKQGGGYKYFYIIGVADTLLTVTGGSDYTVANSAITDNHHSKSENPVGFPSYFAYTPTWTGSTSNPAIGNGSLQGYFSIRKRLVEFSFQIAMGSTTTYGSGNFELTIPVTALAQNIFGSYGLSLCAGNVYVFIPHLYTLSKMWFYSSAVPSTTLAAAAPGAWANANYIRGGVTYIME